MTEKRYESKIGKIRHNMRLRKTLRLEENKIRISQEQNPKPQACASSNVGCKNQDYHIVYKFVKMYKP